MIYRLGSPMPKKLHLNLLFPVYQVVWAMWNHDTSTRYKAFISPVYNVFGCKNKDQGQQSFKLNLWFPGGQELWICQARCYIYSNNLATSVACSNIKVYFPRMLQAHLRSAKALLTSSAVQSWWSRLCLEQTSLVSQQSEERGHEPYVPLNFCLKVRHITSTPIS